MTNQLKRSVSLVKGTLTQLDKLPIEIKRQLEEMRELDEKAYKLENESIIVYHDYVVNVRKLSGHTRRTMKSSIANMQKQTSDLCEEKVKLAKSLSECLDNHIQKLDESLEEYEQSIVESLSKKNRKSGSSPTSKSGKTPKRVGKPTNKRHKPTLLTHSILKHSLPNSEETGTQMSNIQLLGGRSDMPVDPHEPTYCICHNVSYGEMVGCDNPDCPIEFVKKIAFTF